MRDRTHTGHKSGLPFQVLAAVVIGIGVYLTGRLIRAGGEKRRAIRDLYERGARIWAHVSSDFNEVGRSLIEVE